MGVRWVKSRVVYLTSRLKAHMLSVRSVFNDTMPLFSLFGTAHSRDTYSLDCPLATVNHDCRFIYFAATLSSLNFVLFCFSISLRRAQIVFGTIARAEIGRGRRR